MILPRQKMIPTEQMSFLGILMFSCHYPDLTHMTYHPPGGVSDPSMEVQNDEAWSRKFIACTPKSYEPSPKAE